MDRIIEKVEEILNNSRNNSDSDTKKLITILEKLLPDIMNHLKEIRLTLPNFDIHDESHAIQVLENMLTLSNYYEETSLKLTNYEYFMIILSAFMHDTGMALPKWELNLFKATEGSREFGLYSDDLSISINNDGEKPFSFSKAREFIINNKNDIYNKFEDIKSFVFMKETEGEFIEYLAKKLINYQEFRNGYSFELSSVGMLSEYKLKSESIRYEYIRQNHHLFSEANCKLLASKIARDIELFGANKISEDISKISVGHGLEFSEIVNYDMKSRYSSGNFANIFFITVLLRLGDVIHFTAERAPGSLMATKMIQDSVSRMHWEVKQEGIECWLTDFNDKEQREIAYGVYFKNPKSYYFFQDYINWVDTEISNYNIFLNILRKNTNISETIEFYDIKLSEKVNRQSVEYDKESFEPVENLKFTLNQTRILELLMGVGLYKDKYLCLRELYQNALDACKCAIANNSISEGIIEFGINEDKNGSFLYCLDNGIGMTKQIIEEYFLNIGTSYYKSRQFYERKTVWDKSVFPTSQFGIGILSCFMIGDELEVVTRNSYETGSFFTSFRIDGPHERFYYKKADESDKEMIGKNGTLIKVYINDDILNCDFIENIVDKIFLLKAEKNNKDTEADKILKRKIVK